MLIDTRNSNIDTQESSSGYLYTNSCPRGEKYIWMAPASRHFRCTMATWQQNCDIFQQNEKLTSDDLMKSSLARLVADVSIMVDDSSMMMLPSGPTLTCGTGIASASASASLLGSLAFSSIKMSEHIRKTSVHMIVSLRFTYIECHLKLHCTEME